MLFLTASNGIISVMPYRGKGHAAAATATRKQAAQCNIDRKKNPALPHKALQF